MHGDWGRQVDPTGRAFWESREPQLSFYETDGEWKRLVDHNQRIYWSNPTTNVRFLERPECFL